MTNETQKAALLQGSGFFKDFEKPVLDKIIPLLTESVFRADNMVCLKGDDSDSLYIIREGEVDISVSSRDGKIILLGTMGPGDVFGEIGLLDGGSRTANVTARTDVKLYKLTADAFREASALFTLNEWMAITNYICILFRRVTNNLEETVFLDTNLRILKKLLEIAEKNGDREGNKVRLEISQENLGRMVGLSREATNKTLSRLADTGLIERKYKNLLIPDIERLRATIEREEA